MIDAIAGLALFSGAAAMFARCVEELALHHVGRATVSAVLALVLGCLGFQLLVFGARRPRP